MTLIHINTNTSGSVTVYMRVICFPADAEIHAIFSKFNKVVCVIKTVVLADTDFNCFFIPLYRTHAAECHVALWLRHPPGGPEASSGLQQQPRGNLLELLTCWRTRATRMHTNVLEKLKCFYKNQSDPVGKCVILLRKAALWNVVWMFNCS